MVEFANVHDARIIGPNCLGIIVPDVIKMGGIGGPAKDAAKAYSPGPVGVISPLGRHDDRDVLDADRRRPGPVDRRLDRRRRDHRPVLRRADAALRGRRGRRRRSSSTPSRAAAWRPSWPSWVTENDSRLPIVAFMAGRFMDEMPGMSFGHAGTIVEGKEDTADREDRPPGRGRDPRGRGDRADPRPRQGEDRGVTACEPTERFIGVEVDDASRRRRGAGREARGRLPGRHLRRDRRAELTIVEANLDECILCRLCIDAAPQGTVRVRQALRRGAEPGPVVVDLLAPPTLGPCPSSPRSSAPAR